MSCVSGMGVGENNFSLILTRASLLTTHPLLSIDLPKNNKPNGSCHTKPILFIQKRYQDLKKRLRVAMCCPFWINKDRFHAPPVWLVIFRQVNNYCNLCLCSPIAKVPCTKNRLSSSPFVKSTWVSCKRQRANSL